jgi:hypothetical protein
MIVSPDVLRLEQQRMSDLMRDQILINLKMSKKMDNIWLEIQTTSVEELMNIIKSLPMCKDLYFQVYDII